MKIQDSISKKLTALILVMSMLCSLLPFGVQKIIAADNLDGHSVEIYQKVGNYTELTESYSMVGGVVSEASSNWVSTYIRGKANMAIYKIPLPAYHQSLDIDRFILRFGHGKQANYKIMKMDYDKWDFSSLPMTVSLSDSRLAPMIGSAYNTAFDANAAPIIETETDINEIYVSYADISSYAREAYENKQTHFYVAVGAWNSTHNVSLSSLKDTTYKAAGAKPGIYYNFKSPYPEEKTSYPKISPDEFEALFPETVKDGHPWLFGRREDFDRIKEYAFGKDETMTEMYQKFKDDATVYVDRGVSKITTDIVENSYISRAQTAMDIIMRCAFVYMVEGEEAKDYADRALAETMYFVDEMETWGRAQSLDVNFTATGIAICYDWLYDYMTKEQRTKIANAMFDKHLNEVYDFFNNPTKPEYKWSFHQQYLGSSNHAMMDNNSVFVQALAVADFAPEKSASIMSLALEHLTKHNGAFDNLYPDSGWYEGSSYWSMVGPLMARTFSAMDSAFGTTFGFENNTYITGTGYFPIYTQSNLTRILYCDGYAGKTLSSDFFWFGKMSGDEALQSHVLKNKYYTNPLLCLWYNPEDKPNGELSLQKDKLFRNIDVGSMRSSWESSDELFAAMTVQNPKKSHAFMAMGTLMLDALGETWITNPGKEYYSIGDYWNTAQDGTRWTYYSTRPEANSCLVINPSEDGGQLVTSLAMIDKMESSDQRAFMVSDLSTAYKDAEKYQRGLMLYDNRSKVMLQDEVSLKATSDIMSFINVYQADIKLAEDGSYAILSKGKKHIYVKVISNKPYELTTYEACSSAIGTSPVPDVEQTDFTADFERLCVKYDDVSGDVSLTLVFVPFLSDAIPNVSETIVPIDLWTADENNPKKPVLTSLSINGETVKDFRSDVTHYTVPLEYFEADIDAVAENADIEIKNNYRENSFEIYLTDETTGAKNHYSIEVLLIGEIVADTSIGGSLSDADYHLKFNYGSKETVPMRIMTKYSIMPYYKIRMPYIPLGKKPGKTELILNQYRRTNSTTKDSYEFHLVSPQSWQENTLNYYNAPVRLTYDTDWYPYMRQDESGSYTVESTADYTAKLVEVETIPNRQAYNDRFYKEHFYDLSALVDKSDFSNPHSKDNIFSFAMGHVILTNYSSGSFTMIASKEHSQKELRPKLWVSMENDENAEGVYAEKAKLIKNPSGNELYFEAENANVVFGDTFSAITYAVNFEEYKKDVTVYVAEYDNYGKLVKINSFTDNVNSGESKTILTPSCIAEKNTKSVKVFIWTDGVKPVKEQ